MSDDLACVIYSNINKNTLVEKLRQLLFEKDDASFYAYDNDVEILKNLDFDPVKCQQFPDGFLYFCQRIEIFPDESRKSSLENQIALVSMILKYLWSQGISAVAACDYEAQLPNNGGYKSVEIPWVTS